jgi:hypothetical protein
LLSVTVAVLAEEGTARESAAGESTVGNPAAGVCADPEELAGVELIGPELIGPDPEESAGPESTGGVVCAGSAVRVAGSPSGMLGACGLKALLGAKDPLASVGAFPAFGACNFVKTDMHSLSTTKFAVFTGVCRVLGRIGSLGLAMIPKQNGYPQKIHSYPQNSPEVCVRQTFTFRF